MALLNPSSLTFAQAQDRVAWSAGTQGDSEQQTRAGYAVRWALQKWNNAHDWKFLQATATASIGLATDGIYDLPTGFKYMYGVRLGGKTVFPLSRRLYNRVVPDMALPEFSRVFYDLYWAGGEAKIAFVPVPIYAAGSEATAIYYYHKRIALPSGSSDVLQIPEDHELAIIALSKALYLADRADSGQDSMIRMWQGYADQELAQAKLADSRLPDDEPAFMADDRSFFMYSDIDDVHPWLVR